MWDDDQDLRDALRTELIDWTPPPLGGGLAEVLRLGRRRRRAHQASAALALVTAITGMAFLAVPSVDRQVPRCAIPDTSQRNVSTVRASADLQQRVADALHAVAGGATVGHLTERGTPSGTIDYTADITDAGGTGSVSFSIGAFNCDPPKRQVLRDGTVLQIYPPQRGEPFASLTQVLRIYRPDGTLYTLAVHNFGSPDFAPNPDQPDVPQRVGAGRKTLPLTESQLTDLGLATAKN